MQHRKHQKKQTSRCVPQTVSNGLRSTTETKLRVCLRIRPHAHTSALAPHPDLQMHHAAWLQLATFRTHNKTTNTFQYLDNTVRHNGKQQLENCSTRTPRDPHALGNTNASERTATKQHSTTHLTQRSHPPQWKRQCLHAQPGAVWSDCSHRGNAQSQTRKAML